MSKKKEKILGGSILIVAGTLFNLVFTASLHRLLTRQSTVFELVSVQECFAGFMSGKEQGLLFLSFEGFLLICIVLLCVQNRGGYQSDLMKVTDEIATPVPVGQFQHGSSRWMREKEKDQMFQYCEIDPGYAQIRELVVTGYDDLDFMRNRQDVDIGITEMCREKETFCDTVPIEEDAKKKNRERKVMQKNDHRAPKKGGIVVGMTKNGRKEKIHYIADDTHTLTIGATRSGKTRTLVLQSICLMALAEESLVISDPKAELYQYTAVFLAKLGYDVVCLDFRTPAKSSRYNLLQPVIDAVNCGETDKAEMYAWDITNILVGDGVSNEKLWENGEKSIIAAAVLCGVVDNARRPEYQNLTNVYWFVAEMCKAIGNKTPLQEYIKKLPQGHPARALLSISDVAPSRTKGSFYTSALTTLRLFTSRAIYSITHTSDCNIAEIGQKKQALFFILPDEKTTYYPIASLMVSQLYELLVHQSDMRGGRLGRRVNFMLEEFGNFSKINDLANKLTVAGGRGMRFHFFLQSFEQLTEKYNRETAAIVKSNCQTWVYLQADDKETLSEICEKLGKYTCSGYQLTSQHGRYVNPSSSSSVSLMGRDLLTPDEIRRVSRPYQIVISRSHPAMMISPDLGNWYFNQMLGLGDKEHNRRVRQERENRRPVISDPGEEIRLWNIWVYYTRDLQMKEARQKQQSPLQGAVFSEKFMSRGGMMSDDEEDS